MENDLVNEIFEAFGGVTGLAKALKEPITTVHYWKQSGSIPTWRMDAIKQAARRKRISLPAGEGQ